jgi:hypothetical protein
MTWTLMISELVVSVNSNARIMLDACSRCLLESPAQLTNISAVSHFLESRRLPLVRVRLFLAMTPYQRWLPLMWLASQCASQWIPPPPYGPVCKDCPNIIFSLTDVQPALKYSAL